VDASILTRKIGPLPGWAWGGLVAVAAWYFFLRSKPGTTTGSTSAAGASATPGPDATYGLGFAQGQQAAGASAMPAPVPTSPAAPALFMTATKGGGYIYSTPGGANNGSLLGFFAGQPLKILGPAVPGPNYGSSTSPGLVGVTSNQYLPVQYGSQTGYVWAPEVVVGTGPDNGTGIGGVGTSRKFAIGSRRSAPVWSDAHPLVGGPVRYPHYIQAVGGPGNHRREVARVARQAGVHPARVAMLNPTYTGRIRVA
jgi:hypothetical protein